MLELWTFEQEIVDNLISISIRSCLGLQTIHDGDWLLGLLLLSQLLVLLNDGVSLLQFGLVGLHLLSGEGNLAKRCQERCDIIRGQIVLGQPQELQAPILLKYLAESLDRFSGKLVVREVKDLEVAVHWQLSVRFQRQHHVTQVFVIQLASPQEQYLQLLGV